MIYWIGYLIFLAFAVFVDYKLFAVVGTENTNKKAIQSMTYWAMITIATMVFIYFGYENDIFQGYLSQDTSLSGAKAISLFFTGYLIEQSLSIDNIFVMAFLLSYFPMDTTIPTLALPVHDRPFHIQARSLVVMRPSR